MMVGGRIAKLEHTMENVWTRVVHVFAERAVTCDFTFNHYDHNREDTPPHIHFERTTGSSQFVGTRSSSGEFARITQASNAYVWGLQSGEDYEKHQALAALGLVVELMGAIYAVAPRYPDDGLNGLEIEYSAETHMLKYGAQFVVSFQFFAPIKWVTADEYLLIGGVDANLNPRS